MPATEPSRAAGIDAVTGLPNRALIEHHLAGALTRVLRAHSSAGLLVLDIDDFTALNSACGNDVGDSVLRAVAERLNARLPASALLGRLENDAFAIVVDDAADAVALAEQGERLLEIFNRPFAANGSVLDVTASAGVAFGATGHFDACALINEAAGGAERAYRAGGGRIAFLDPQLDREAGRRRDLRNDFVRALARDELVLHYQPLVDVATGAPAFVEALVRWQHPERGLLTPIEFIPLAEESGLIEPMGTWALSDACRQLAAWDAAAVHVPRVAVNLSAREMCSPHLPGRVRGALRESGVTADRLELELTESMFADPERTRRTLSELREIGVRVAIDDFGTGFSSLNYLTRFAVDTIKIDGSFVAAMCDEQESAAVVAAIVAMGHSLGLDVVAERVETEEQLALLRGLGCDYIQGHLFSRPLEPHALAAWMAESGGAKVAPARRLLPGRVRS